MDSKELRKAIKKLEEANGGTFPVQTSVPGYRDADVTGAIMAHGSIRLTTNPKTREHTDGAKPESGEQPET